MSSLYMRSVSGQYMPLCLQEREASEAEDRDSVLSGYSKQDSIIDNVSVLTRDIEKFTNRALNVII